MSAGEETDEVRRHSRSQPSRPMMILLRVVAPSRRQVLSRWCDSGYAALPQCHPTRRYQTRTPHQA
jgi:hypothetical protein